MIKDDADADVDDETQGFTGTKLIIFFSPSPEMDFVSGTNFEHQKRLFMRKEVLRAKAKL
ncbi:hypothetical protein QR98_0014640 [Sarcoptes scabiei]|uniref:Uncharacterized protein n=1 Tax=Sarcoptes scabiei TaxID=52283 RepID=A0A131ZXM1_SARSC|nr:hypothetical protein QR98_0014640 [Sarcoptes scabiei]